MDALSDWPNRLTLALAAMLDAEAALSRGDIAQAREALEVAVATAKQVRGMLPHA